MSYFSLIERLSLLSPGSSMVKDGGHEYRPAHSYCGVVKS